ncbi:glycosyltransferase [Helicobacter muridarum]|nr:glycosyltransferase [Helicobacter muridarum]STQ85507.1 putative glycosyl transferase [Helicobacter muridarum]
MFHKTQQDIMRNWHIGLESNLDCLDSKQNQLTESKANLYNSNQSLKPLCSFLCITYNHIDFIEQCLIGFLEQETTFPFEIIIHDDCSTDGTDRIIKEYQSKYPQIIKAMYEEENQYSKGDKGKPFWAIMHNMAGKYIALCEGDDYWNDIHKIQKQVAFLESNPEFVGCYHRCHTILSDGTMYKEDLGSQYKDISARMLQRLEVGISTRTICYRNVVDYLEPTLHYYHYKILNGDTFLWTLLGQHGSIRYMSDINPSYYRLHAGGIWSSLSDKTRFIIHTKSFFYMSEYYSEIGNYTAASFFFQLSLRNLCFASDASLMQDDVDSVIKTLLNKRGGAKYLWVGFVHLLSRLFCDCSSHALISLSFPYERG